MHGAVTTLWVAGEQVRQAAVDACLNLFQPEQIILDEQLSTWWKPHLNGVPIREVTTLVPKKVSGTALFYCQSDTIVKSLTPIADSLPNGLQSRYLIPYHSKEGAGPELRANGKAVSQDLIKSLFGSDVRILVLANDWGPDARFLINLARLRGLPTVCLQESVIDLDNIVEKRMRQADHVLLQGPATLTKLPRKSFWLTGNPRYEMLKPSPRPYPGKVLVNCNFTYGIQTGHRDTWLELCTNVLKSIGLSYIIAQHPRDKADITRFGPVLGTSAATIHDILRQTSAVISRFSSVLHEGIAVGRPGIYFNPHGEKIGYDFEPDGIGLMMEESAEGLKYSLIKCHSDNFLKERILEKGLASYMARHIRPFNESPRQLAAEAIYRIGTRCYPSSGALDNVRWQMRNLKFMLMSKLRQTDK